MKSWNAFLKDVRPGAPGTPAPIAEHAVMRAARAFCERTRAWRVELDPTTTREGVKAYDIELETATELVRLESATLNGEDYRVWRGGDDRHGRFVFTSDTKTVEFSRAVTAGLPLVLTCAVKPGNAARGIDDAIYDQYAEVIALAAVARLTSDPNKQLEFENECDRIKTRLWRGMAATRPRSRPHFF